MRDSDGFTDEMPNKKPKFVKKPNWIQRQLIRLLRVEPEVWTVNQPPPPIGWGFWADVPNVNSETYIDVRDGVPAIVIVVKGCGVVQKASIFYDIYPLGDFYFRSKITVSTDMELIIPLRSLCDEIHKHSKFFRGIKELAIKEGLHHVPA